MEETKLDYKSIFQYGRKRAFETNEELQDKIIEYFEEGAPTRRIFAGGEPYYVKVLTITGLTLFLGFADRQSFYDYEKRGLKHEKEEIEKDPKKAEEYQISCTLKRARSFIENEYETQLQGGSATGAIFALKNFGWKDIQTFEGELNDNGERKFVIEHKRSKYENLDDNGDPIIEDGEKSTS